MADRIFSRSAAWEYFTSKTVPPVNSIDRLRPFDHKKKIAARKVMKEIAFKNSA
jgi:hypothetical protein